MSSGFKEVKGSGFAYCGCWGVKKGIEFLVTSHGKKIARLVPEVSAAKESHNKRKGVRVA